MQNDTLEISSTLDRHGLAHLLDMIEHICHEKAAHINETWQDKSLARTWTKAAWAVRTCAASDNVRVISEPCEAR